MNAVEPAGGHPTRPFGMRLIASLLPMCLLCAACVQSSTARQDAPAAAQAATPQPPYVQQTPEQLQQLVAPIALYPDSLVAQILAASTFPEQIVEAQRWVQANPAVQGNALALAIEQQPWDPSVKALAAFPTVLGNMDKNLSWTSSLGDAYYNQQTAVMDAVQTMRQRAHAAGNLQTTPQQTVATQDASIVIQPVSPEVVYVPAYDPWSIYGAPIVAWPDWYAYPGIWYDGPDLSFGLGIGIGFYGGFGWGWGNWGFDWHGRYPMYDHARYHSSSNTFFNRSNYYRAGRERGVQSNVARGSSGNRAANDERAGGRPGAAAAPGGRDEARGFAEARGASGVHSGAFSGYDHGGQTRSFSSRGSSSFGGGGHGGGGHGGGGHGGGRSR